MRRSRIGRWAATPFALLIALGPIMAAAEDSVALWGNYYKEKSTRVISPMVTLRKELPAGGQLDVTYIVDQVTSASVAFGPREDQAFSEYRNEVRAQYSMRFLDVVTPSIGARYSYEPDYTSAGVNAALTVDLNDKLTSIQGFFSGNFDSIRSRRNPDFDDALGTYAFGGSVTQILTKRLLLTLSGDVQVLYGYQENQYRVEQHPRQRTRYSLNLLGRYRFPSTRTTVQASYGFYADNWEVAAHRGFVQVHQRITPWLTIVPLVRLHTQSAVFFDEFNRGFRTTDPRLRAFGTQQVGLRALLTLRFLQDGWLDPFADSQVVPAYYYYNQGNRYGDAHIAQLGWYWPF